MQQRQTLLQIVADTVVYDLDLSDPLIHSTAEWGHRAAAAATGGSFARGNLGDGTGGTASKGPGCVRTKGGLGSASLFLPGGIVVAALVVIKSLGDLIHPLTGRLYASDGGFGVPLLYRLRDEPSVVDRSLANTTLGIVATNAELDKHQLIKIADLAHDGLARAIRPVHTTLDGDAIFALSPNDGAVSLPDTTEANLTDLIGAAGADAMVLTVLDAAAQTEGMDTWPSVAEARRQWTTRSRPTNKAGPSQAAAAIATAAPGAACLTPSRRQRTSDVLGW